jgi:hypothetical protein
MTKKDEEEFAEFLNSLSAPMRQKINQQQLQESEIEHREFKQAIERGVCYLCEQPISLAPKGRPCLHSLLRPIGIGKSEILDTIKRHGFFRTQTYLRWVANAEAFGRNINDLPEEGTGKKFEVTIRYKKIEWSFSCSDSDYVGHRNHRYPHFHFQMREEARQFINFNDEHIPFLKDEIFAIEAMRKYPDKVKTKFLFGEGMNDILLDETVEELISIPRSTETKSENAAFKLDSFAIADEGTTISGDDLYEIIQEAKAKKVPVASLLHKLPNANVRVVVTPGPGVVEQAVRSGGRRKNKPTSSGA